MFKSCSILNAEYIDFKKGLNLSIKNRKSLLKEYNNKKFIFLYSGANIHQFNSKFFEDKAAKKVLSFYG